MKRCKNQETERQKKRYQKDGKIVTQKDRKTE